MRKEKKYSGIIVPMITPFKENGSIDVNASEKIIEKFVHYECDALLFGTTGETASIPQKLKTLHVELISRNYKKRTKIYAAISDNCFEDAVTNANTYLDLGVEAVVVLLPGYYPLTSDQMLKYYEKFAESLNGSMFLYNIPATTHLSIPIEVIEKLSYHERIIGIKDSERDLDRLNHSISLWKDREDFSHFVGWGAQCFNGMWLGSDGIVPSTGNFDLSFYKQMYEAVLNEDKLKGEEAQNISMEISGVYQKDRILSQSLAALKVMMNEIELCKTKVRLPLTQLSIEEERKVRIDTQNIITKYNLR
jgi:4-hydroxy-tetrahydrodipicolinate synthase